MAHRSKKSGDARERNLILVASPSDAFPDIPHFIPTGSSAGHNLFQSFREPETVRAKPEPLLDQAQRYAQDCLYY